MSRANLKFKPKTISFCVKKSFFRFADETKINGLNYLRKNANGKYSR